MRLVSILDKIVISREKYVTVNFISAELVFIEEKFVF